MARQTKHRGRWRLPALIAGLLLAGIGTALATSGNLPGGTAISTEITTPADGALVAYPTGNVQTEGTASVGEGTPIANTLLVYVLDVSYSTNSGSNGCGGDQNGDTKSNTILDCEIAAAEALNNIATGTGTVARVGVAVFGGKSVNDPSDTGGDVADVGPSAGDQLFTGPSTDVNGTDGHDVSEVLSSAFSIASPTDAGVQEFSFKDVGSDGTNFAAGLSAALDIVSASNTSPASPNITNKIIVFMSDGLANTGADIDTVTVPSDIVIKAFAIGSTSNCDDDPRDLGSLSQLAAKGSAGSACRHVETVADLPNVIPEVIASQLSALSLRIDGGAPTDITASSSPALPVTGPNSVAYSHLVPGLVPNIHQICVTAAGSDGGGTGSVTDCAQVTVATIYLDPAEATNELGTPGQTHTVTAQVAAGPAGGVSGVTVSFDVFAGPNTGAGGSGTTDSSGNAAFTYTAKQGPAGLGTDFIEACFTDSQGNRACNRAMKHWVDTTAPIVGCTETVNPHGRKIPPAGSTTLPGPKGGQNEDGFYQLNAEDTLDSDPKIYLTDTGSGTVFGPFSNGTRIKYTEANGTNPRVKSIGSTRGRAGAVAVHLLGNGDASIHAVDASQNASDPVDCLVPQPPK